MSIIIFFIRRIKETNLATKIVGVFWGKIIADISNKKTPKSFFSKIIKKIIVIFLKLFFW
jgi:uncharacterized protein YacL